MNPVPAAIKAYARAQVNLLPPEVNEKRARARIRSIVLLGFAAFVALIAVGYMGLAFLASQAQSDLHDAQAETERINTEIATYSEVDAVKARLLNSQSAAYTAAGVEIFWPYVVGSIQSAVPVESVVDSVTLTLPDLNTSAALPEAAFDVASIGSAHVILRTAQPVEAARVERALAATDIFTRARVESIQFKEADDSTGEPAYYELDAKVTFSYDMLTMRFTDYWSGDAEGGKSLEDFYRNYFTQMSGGVIPGWSVPPLPKAERPIPVPNAPDGAPAPAPEPSPSPSAEGEA